MSVLKIFAGLLLFSLLFAVGSANANIPFRVSVKFIVDADGNRPGAGDFNSTADVNDQEVTGNVVLANMVSELRMDVIEIIDLPTSLSSFSTVSVSDTNRDDIRAAARADPATWSWRTNAVNVYVTGGSGSAISKFPPSNDIILMGQSIFATTLVHELGHSLHLLHTHETAGSSGDNCSDTLPDNSSWNSKDDMANNSFGKDYALLTSAQQAQVDMTWSNIMSYHQPRSELSPCQKDRMSYTASNDVTWLLSKVPVYIHPQNSYDRCFFSQLCNGSFAFPYANLQQVLLLTDVFGQDHLSGKSIVMEQGTYTMNWPTGLNLDVDMYTRQGVSKVDNEALLYELPTKMSVPGSAADLAVKAAQREATLGRKALRDGEKAAAAALKQNRKAIMAKAKEKHKKHKAKALKHYETAEKQASGRERHAIQMELGQRYRQSGNYVKCFTYYKRVADDTDQLHLKEKALRSAEECQKKRAVKSKRTIESEEE